MGLLKTAYSSPNFCFICKRKKIKPYSVKSKSKMEAFVNYRIILKQNSRCCSVHLDDNGELKNDQYEKIPTSLKYYSQDTIDIFKSYFLLIRSKKKNSYF